MSIMVTSTTAKGDAKKIQEVLDRYEWMAFDIKVDDEGNLRLSNDKRQKDEEQAKREASDTELTDPLWGYPLAFKRRKVPSRDEYLNAWKEALEAEGALGFSDLLQDLATVLQTPLTVMTAKLDQDAHYYAAEAWSIEPGGKEPQRVGIEYGDVLYVQLGQRSEYLKEARDTEDEVESNEDTPKNEAAEGPKESGTQQ